MVDLDTNGFADLLLVSAPLHNDGDQEGKVFIYTFATSGFKVKVKDNSPKLSKLNQSCLLILNILLKMPIQP